MNLYLSELWKKHQYENELKNPDYGEWTKQEALAFIGRPLTQETISIDEDFLEELRRM